MSKPRYRYAILVDGNGLYFVRRQSTSWWPRDSDRPVYAHQLQEETTRGGRNPSPQRAFVLTDTFQWSVYPQDCTKFPDSHAAAKALVYLQEQDQRQVASRQETVVIEETK